MRQAAIILGSASEIGIYLRERLDAEGWQTHGWKRGDNVPSQRWNLALCCIGQVAPVGLWPTAYRFDSAIESNLLLPLRLLRSIWDMRRPDAAVCFLAGSNPNRTMAGYSAYNVGKMALLKAVESMDAETPDAKFFALGPGYIPTKIHRATFEANWPNEVIARGPTATMEGVYACLKWCIDQPKNVIGGRNICASDPIGNELAARLALNLSLYKLRRIE